MPHKPPKSDTATSSQRLSALSLIRKQRTMIIATGAAGTPWATPVYYVFNSPGFYFFSSPKARHAQDAVQSKYAAATIFFDNGRWEQIQGVQMSGKIETITKTIQQVKIGALFILKFPFAEPFLQTNAQTDTDTNKDSEPPKLGDRVRLCGFFPEEIYYLNNKVGFGRRERIEL